MSHLKLPPFWTDAPVAWCAAVEAQWGERRRTVILGGHHYTWAFLLADVQFHIIGVAFLQHFQLLVDVAANGLRPALSPHTLVAAVPAPEQVLQQSSSPSPPTVEAPSPPSLLTVEALLPPPLPPAAKQGPSPSQHLSTSEAALLTEFADVLNADPPTSF